MENRKVPKLGMYLISQIAPPIFLLICALLSYVDATPGGAIRLISWADVNPIQRILFALFSMLGLAGLLWGIRNIQRISFLILNTSPKKMDVWFLYRPFPNRFNIRISQVSALGIHCEWRFLAISDAPGFSPLQDTKREAEVYSDPETGKPGLVIFEDQVFFPIGLRRKKELGNTVGGI